MRATIGRRLHLPHPHGVVINGRCVIGDDCMIRHNVTLGAGSHTRGGFPTLGDRVQIGPGAVVMGAVTVGDDVLIGPNAVVVQDVPPGSRVLAPAATVRPPKDPQAAEPGEGAVGVEGDPHGQPPARVGARAGALGNVPGPRVVAVQGGAPDSPGPRPGVSGTG